MTMWMVRIYLFSSFFFLTLYFFLPDTFTQRVLLSYLKQSYLRRNTLDSLISSLEFNIANNKVSAFSANSFSKSKLYFFLFLSPQKRIDEKIGNDPDSFKLTFVTTGWTGVNISDIADQMTYFSTLLFLDMTPKDLIGVSQRKQCYSIKIRYRSLFLFANVSLIFSHLRRAIIVHYTNVTQWVSNTIDSSSSSSQSLSLLTRFVSLVEALLERSNLADAKTVFEGIIKSERWRERDGEKERGAGEERERKVMGKFVSLFLKGNELEVYMESLYQNGLPVSIIFVPQLFSPCFRLISLHR